MSNKGFLISAVILMLAVFTGFHFYSKAKPEQKQASLLIASTKSVDSSSAAYFAREHSPSFGNRMARVTMTEWFDPECESCRAIHPTVKRMIAEYGDRVHFVFRYMPLHPGSMYAATVLEEAREMGKFEEALDIIFDKQPEWGSHENPNPNLIPAYLKGLGIPSESLEHDKVIAKHGDKIRIDQEDGRKVGVRGTPSFFINEQLVAELGDEPLRAAIEAALESAASN